MCVLVAPVEVTAEQVLVAAKSHAAWVRRRLPGACVDDVIQDAAIAAIRRKTTYDKGLGSLEAWVFGYVKTVTARYLSSLSTRPAQLKHEGVDESDNPLMLVMDLYAQADFLSWVVSSVTRRQWQIFTQIHVEGLGVDEVARLHGLKRRQVFQDKAQVLIVAATVHAALQGRGDGCDFRAVIPDPVLGLLGDGELQRRVCAGECVTVEEVAVSAGVTCKVASRRLQQVRDLVWLAADIWRAKT